METYLLDLNIISYLADTDSPYHRNVLECFGKLKNQDTVYFSIISLYELQYSVSQAGSEEMAKEITETKKHICSTFHIVSLSIEGAQIFGDLKSAYRLKHSIAKRNLARDTVDLIIASSAIENQATMVSHDTIFKKIQKIHPELKLEDWAAP